MTPWDEFKKRENYLLLTQDTRVDVAIVGAGMAGALIAYRLAKAGVSVALVEKKEIGYGATGATTAFITEVIDSPLSQIAEIFSPQIAKAVWESGRAAIEKFDKIIEEENIDCEFVRCSNFVYASTPHQAKELQEEAKSYQRFKIASKLHKPTEKIGFKNYGFLKVPNQAKFHPSKFLYSIIEKAEAAGAQIYENTPVTSINGTGLVTIETPEASIVANDVVIATYKPLTSEGTYLKKAMYRSYVFEVRLTKGILEEGLYEDLSNPYHYFRIDRGEDYDRMIIGGEDHKDIFGDTLVHKSFEALEKYLDKLLPKERYKIVRKWYGPILEPSDGLPLIGEIKPHYYVATAFSGNGMTYSMISSMLISDLILGKKNVWTKPYDPTRTLFHPKRLLTKAQDYIEEFYSGALQNLLK